MALIDAYKAILKALRLEVTEDGFVRNADEEQVMVSKKSLVLPIPAQLAVADMSNRIYFNPFRENALASETPAVTEYIRGRFLEQISIKTMLLIADLTDIAGKTAVHPELNPEQLEFLVHIKDIDETFATNLARVLDKLAENPLRTNGVTHVFSRKNSKLGDKEYRRVAFVSFPLYEILEGGDKEQLKQAGMTGLRPKDRKILQAMLKYIFPSIDVANHYSKGSGSGICPYMDSLMQAFGGLIERLNDVAELFADYIESRDMIITPVEWFDAFQDLSIYQNELRMLGIGGDSVTPNAQLENSISAAVGNIGSVAQPGSPVVITMPGANGMVSLMSPGAATLAVAPKTANGAVDLSTVIASNPMLQQQLALQMLANNPAYAAHLTQMKMQNELSSKARRWSFGGTAGAANPNLIPLQETTSFMPLNII